MAEWSWKSLSTYLLVIFGPNLYGEYAAPAAVDMETNIFDYIGTIGCNVVYFLYRCSVAFLPVTLWQLYKRTNGGKNFIVPFTCLIIAGSMFLVRAIGRFQNRRYMNMAKILAEHNKYPNDRAVLKKLFGNYNISLRFVKGYKLNFPTTRPFVDEYKFDPKDDYVNIILGSLAIHVLGRRMIFPGSLTPLKMLLQSTVNAERTAFMNKNSSAAVERIPVCSRNGNVIDTIFVDQRKDKSCTLGKILVIVSDGNAGYCERGLCQSWVDAGYSTLAYNAPGCGESTGTPYYDQICDAAEAVMVLAKQLGFHPEDICAYGWSIGGFASCWFAANYPVRGLILDATFDSLIPLAESTIFGVFPNVIRFAIGYYFNMNVSKLIARYSGPVTFIRRRFDEVIVTDRSNFVKACRSNRINFLFKDFLAARYHFLNWTALDNIVVEEWLDANDEQRRLWLSEDGMEREIYEYMPRDPDTASELDADERAYIVRRICFWHFIDLELTHNVTLPSIRCVLPDPIIPVDS